MLGVDSKELVKEWQHSIAAYRPDCRQTKMPRPMPARSSSRSTARGGMNVGPEISPDGTADRVFSERGLFSIDLT